MFNFIIFFERLGASPHLGEKVYTQFQNWNLVAMSIWPFSNYFEMIFEHNFEYFFAFVKHKATNLTSLIAIFDKI